MPNSDNNIVYERLIQRSGKRQDLKKLENAEFGFATDTSQLFIGSNLSQDSYIKPNVVALDPIPNVKNFVRSILDNSPYSALVITDDLLITTPDEEVAIDVVAYINQYIVANYQNVKPVARLSSNVEIITERNVHDYFSPALREIDYDVVANQDRIERKLLSKVLNMSTVGVFLELKRNQSSHIVVKYNLVQDRGRHKRSGTIEIFGTRNPIGLMDFVINDEQNLMTPCVSDNDIRFDVVAAATTVRVTYEQPISSETRIFYTIERWGMDEIGDVYSQDSCDISSDPIYGDLGDTNP